VPATTEREATLLPVYTFSLGNSDSGPCGLSIDVHGTTSADALQRLDASLDDLTLIDVTNDDGAVSYAAAYINTSHVTTNDIEDVDDCERDECEQCGEHQDADNEAPETVPT
jgi:hypothetical protein